MQHHKIPVQKTAHVFTSGSLEGNADYLIIACHGYGQLAKFFIRKFDFLDKERFLVVAPEGMSRFYTQGFYGDVGASWMTKENRLIEIDDYALYLSQMLDHFKQKVKPDAKVILYGFSQGCATVMRWIMKDFPTINSIVLYGGLLPEDLDYRPYEDYFKKIDIKWAHGATDKFLTQDRVDWHHAFILQQKLHIQSVPYEGGHEMIREVMKEELLPS
jgi:predicted esterase